MKAPPSYVYALVTHAKLCYATRSAQVIEGVGFGEWLVI